MRGSENSGERGVEGGTYNAGYTGDKSQ